MKRLYLKVLLWWHDYTLALMSDQRSMIEISFEEYNRKRDAIAVELMKCEPPRDKS